MEIGLAAKKAPELEALENQLKVSPEDRDLAFQLAVQYTQHDYHQEALATLFPLINKDINFRQGEAKKVYMDILAILGKGDPLAVEYQRKLYTLLY